jgi:hypothetical protein
MDTRWRDGTTTTTVKSEHRGEQYSLLVEVRSDVAADGSHTDVVTDWYFTSADGKKTARVCRHWRASNRFCVWSFQFRPHPTRPRDSENRHGLQIDNWISGKPSEKQHKHPSTEVESGLWAQAHRTAIEWVTKKRVLPGGLAGWKECGWREGMPLHASVVAKDGAA